MPLFFKDSFQREMPALRELGQSFFSCEGAMYLFGSALNEFLSMYPTVNSFRQLIAGQPG